MVFFLPAKKHLQVFNPGKHYDDQRTKKADNEHAFQNSHQYPDDYETHKQTMLFEMEQVDQLGARGQGKGDGLLVQLTAKATLLF